MPGVGKAKQPDLTTRGVIYRRHAQTRISEAGYARLPGSHSRARELYIDERTADPVFMAAENRTMIYWL